MQKMEIEFKIRPLIHLNGKFFITRLFNEQNLNRIKGTGNTLLKLKGKIEK